MNVQADAQTGATDTGASDTAASAGLNAGFARVRGAEASAPGAGPGAGGDVIDVAAKVVPSPAPSPAATPAGAPAPAAPAASPVSPAPAFDLTPEQTRELLAQVPGLVRENGNLSQQLRQAFGKIGAMQSTIQQLQPKAGDTQTTRQIKADALKRIAANFGPEFAQDLSDDLNEAFGMHAAPTPAPASPAAPATPAAPAADAASAPAAAGPAPAPAGGEQGLTMEQRLEIRLLSRDHPDWKTLPGTADFKLWLAAQPADLQQKANETWDADVFSKILTDYKAAQAQAAQRQKTNTQRLERTAPAPSGGAARQVVLPDSAGLNAGFNKVRGNR